ncbi:S41 family peptidase [Gramella sp. AN32]|uniref:S41 family peptidase n=1 Tax=Christiangramia antarctica TaxID=2058158 RepID=A0ABW5XA58_9FLAO|nr:S41 family peptidase [Gramella sp. AN32]MCM4156501.1 peptidase S41 [Gramella sp. AN32]
MRKIKFLFLILLSVMVFTACSREDMDDTITETEELPPGSTDPTDGLSQAELLELEIKDFIWKGLNNIYLYKDEIPDLADDRFTTQSQLNTFLIGFDSPESLFDALTTDFDRFSFLVDDYVELENSFAGITKTTGADFRLYRYANGSDDIFGIVRYIIPGSNAEQTDLKRGDFFTQINGQDLTVQNYSDLLDSDNVTFTIATIEGNTITPTGNTISIDTQTLTENPILIQKVIEQDGQKIGYLLYNSFIADFDDELNAAFANFKSAGITDLVLDLRYNGGGRVSSATRLASMITGGFTGKIFAKQQWNDYYQNLFLNSSNPGRLFNRFVSTIDNNEPINSLNLERLFVIGTASTASASELVINGLKPYITVKTIGTTTVGKSQASVTLWDSEDFGDQNRNPNHKYAIQPLVYESVNANDQNVPYDGIIPNVEISEDIRNYGALGDPNEPLLAAAIAEITGNRAFIPARETWYEEFSESGVNNPLYQKMYIESVPSEGAQKLKLDLPLKQ